MKIGFTGAGGTGKTTLAKMLAEKLDVPFMQSPSRACFVKHGVKTEDDQKALTPDQRWALQKDIFMAIDKQVSETKVGIFDRTHLDNLGYGLLQCRDTIMSGEYTQMEEVTCHGLATFDLIFYAPIFDWRESVNDGMRTDHLPSRHLHGDFIRGFLVNNGIYYEWLRNKPVEKRLDWILSLCNKHHGKTFS